MCVHVHEGRRESKGREEGKREGGRKGKGREGGREKGGIEKGGREKGGIEKGGREKGGKREGGRKEGWKEGREGGTEVIFWDNIHSYEIIMGIVMISSVNEKRYKIQTATLVPRLLPPSLGTRLQTATL